MNQAEIELTQREAELAREESALHVELERLRKVKEELRGLQESSLAVMMEARGLGAQDDGAADRLAAVQFPESGVEVVMARSRAQRETACKARRELQAQARLQVLGFRKQLAELAERLCKDEEAAQGLLGLARTRRQADESALQAQQAEEARKAEQKQRAEEAAREAKAARTTSESQSVASSRSAETAREPGGAGPPQRVRHRVPMQVAIDFHSDDNFYRGFSANLSDGGVFVATVNLQRIGTEVDLVFSLPTGEQVQAHGVVRWVREVNDKYPDVFPGMGVEFTRIPRDCQAAIDQFLAQREPMFYAT
jgi:uncharacterized protein (TIGR02266 family)